MIVTELHYTANLDRGVTMTPFSLSFLAGDQEAHRIIVDCYRRGNRDAVDLDAAGVTAYFVRADGMTIPLDGMAENNRASVLLPAACYERVGRFSLVVKISLGNSINTIFWGEGAVSSSRTDVIIDPESVIPSLDNLLAQIDAMEEATAAAQMAAEKSLSYKDQIDTPTDFDDITETGYYNVLNDVAGLCTNYPSLIGGVLTVKNRDDGADAPTVQELIDNSNALFIRYKLTGGWTRWTEYVSKNRFDALESDVEKSMSYKAQIDTPTDFDTITGTGFYNVLNGIVDQCTHYPSVRGGVLTVKTRDDGADAPTVQELVDNKNALYVRYKLTSGWTEWLRYSSEGDLDLLESDINAVSGNIAPGYTVVPSVYIDPASQTLKKETGGSRVICVKGKENTWYSVQKPTATIVRAGCGESADLSVGAALVNYAQHNAASALPLAVKTTRKQPYIYIQLYTDQDTEDLRDIEINLASLVVYENNGEPIRELRETVAGRVRYDVGENLLDPDQAMYGVIFRVDGDHAGDIDVRPNGVDTSGCFAAFVKLTGKGVYRMAATTGIYGNTVNRICAYDNERRYLGIITGEYDAERGVLTINVDDDSVRYIGVSHYIAQLYRTAMVVKGIAYPYAYIPFQGGNDVLNGIKVKAGDVIGIEAYPGHVQKAWEQRMLDRIDLAMIPVRAQRKMAKAPSGYIGEGETLTGIVYSSVWDTVGNVGTRVSLSTYYSALENPASVMYTQDLYQDDPDKSTYYGITCSSFVAYAYGWPDVLNSDDLADKYRDNLLTIATEDDLFQVRRGDLLLNTIEDAEDGDHVKLVRDVVYSRETGKLVGFNVAESGRPYVRVTFMTLTEFLGQMSEERPYYIARPPESDFGLRVPVISYSRSIYPDRGDGGRYSVGETVQLYVPDDEAASVTVTHDGSTETYALADLRADVVNDVTVYNLPDLAAGTYSIAVDTAAGDPCTVIVASA